MATRTATRTDPRAHAREMAAVNTGWPIERVVALLAGGFIVGSLALGRAHHPRWRLMTGLIGSNLALQGAVGWCPASLGMHMLGLRGSRERDRGCVS